MVEGEGGVVGDIAYDRTRRNGEGAAGDRGSAGVGVVAREGEDAGADLGERAGARNRAGEGGAFIIGADGERVIAYGNAGDGGVAREAANIVGVRAREDKAQCRVAAVVKCAAGKRVRIAERQRACGESGVAGEGVRAAERGVAAAEQEEAARARDIPRDGCGVCARDGQEIRAKADRAAEGEVAGVGCEKRIALKEEGRVDRLGVGRIVFHIAREGDRVV